MDLLKYMMPDKVLGYGKIEKLFNNEYYILNILW